MSLAICLSKMGEISRPRMKRHRGTSSSTVTKLLMRTTLPDLRETKLEENGDDLYRFENGDVAHAYATATF